MVRNDFISERDAETFAGVSASTLRRFSESGYLTVNGDDSQGRLYSRSQLQDIFGVTQVPTTEPVAATTMENVVTETPQVETVASSPVGPGCSVEQPCTVSTPNIIRADSTVGVCQSQPEESPEGASSGTIAAIAERSTSDATEVERLKNALENQLKLLVQRESEVSDLRSQRDWLQRRIESLEEKSNRDQILLLSETQTIRKLIALQEQKRSGFRQLLSWLGLASPQNLTPLTSSGDVVNIPSNSRPSAHTGNQTSKAEAA